MADTITSSTSVVMEIEFTDGDTRTITQNDPLLDQSSLVAAINDFGDYARTNNLIIGDKTGAAFSYMRSAKIKQVSEANLDIGVST